MHAGKRARSTSRRKHRQQLIYTVLSGDAKSTASEYSRRTKSVVLKTKEEEGPIFTRAKRPAAFAEPGKRQRSANRAAENVFREDARFRPSGIVIVGAERVEPLGEN